MSLKYIPYVSKHMIQSIRFRSFCFSEFSCVYPFIAQRYVCDVSTINYVQRRFRWHPKYPPKPPRHIDFNFTGDLVQRPTDLDLSLPREGYEDVIDTIKDPTIRRLFTLEFASIGERREYKRKHLSGMFKDERDPTSTSPTVEQQISEMVIQIRYLIRHVDSVRKDTSAEGIIRARSKDLQKLLHHLKQTDEERFNWVVEQYGLKLIPPEQKKIKYGPKLQRIEQAKAAFKQVQREELAKIRARVAKEREEFNRVKAQELQAITKELEALGLTLADDIDDTLEELGVERTRPSELQEARRRYEEYLEKSKVVRAQYEEVQKIPEGAEADLP